MSDSKKESFARSSARIYLRLLGYVRPYWIPFAISILGFVIFASSQPAMAWMLKYFVDGLTEGASAQFLGVPLIWGFPLFIILVALYQGIGSYLGNYFIAKVSLGVVHDLRTALFDSLLPRPNRHLAIITSAHLVALYQGIGYYLGNYFIAKVSLGVVHDLRTALFDNLLTLPNRYFDNNNSGHLVSRVTFNVTMVTGAATDAIKVVFREGLTVIFLFGYLLWMNWKLTLVLMAVLPLIGLMVNSTSKKFRKQSKKIQTAMGDVTHVTSETITGYRVVRSFGGEDYESQRFHRASENNRQRGLKMVRTGAGCTPTLQLATYGAMAGVMFLVLFLRGDATAGDLVSYITAAGLLPKPIRQLSEVSANIQKGIAAAESIFEQLDEEPEQDTGTIERDRV